MKIKIITLILLSLILLCSCKEKEPLVINLNDLLSAVQEYIPADTLYEQTDAYLEDVYGFELAKMTQYIAYKDVDMNSANEILLFETDLEYAETVYELISKIQSRLITEIENYTNNPNGITQHEKAKTAIMVREQNYVFFIVSDHNADVSAVVDRFISGG